MEKTVRFIVEGRVHGVGFRNFVYIHALKLNLSGYVRNSDNGSVEVVAHGDDVLLRELHKKLLQGPPMSIVKNVSEYEMKDQSIFNSFKIIL